MVQDNPYSVTEVVNELKSRGFYHTFTIERGKVHSVDTGEFFAPQAMSLLETIRVEDDSNPDEETVVYAVASRSGIKGVIVDSFGRNADPEIAEFIAHLQKVTPRKN